MENELTSEKGMTIEKAKNSVRYEIFCNNYDGELSESEILIVFLKAHCELSVYSIAKICKTRYSNVLRIVDGQKDIIANERLDRKAAVLRRFNVTSEKMLEAKAMELEVIVQELKNRSDDPDRFKLVTDKTLHEMLLKLSSEVRIKNEYIVAGVLAESKIVKEMDSHFD